MAKVSIDLICTECGKKFRHEAKRRNCAEAESYAEWARKNITQCPDCYRKEQRDIQNANEQKLLAGIELAELTGSEKQIAWAESIRQTMCAKCMQHKPKQLFWDAVNDKTSAKWWIDNRYHLEMLAEIEEMLLKDYKGGIYGKEKH